MNVIIIGAGDVGYVAAETIADVHDVLIIERDNDVAEAVKSRLDVSVLHEDGTNPKTLKFAMDTHKPGMVISTLPRDDSNLFVCMMAKRHDPDVKTIASIANPDFMLEPRGDGTDFVDIMISPELITAEKMYRMATNENMVDYEYIGNLGLSLAIFAVENGQGIVGKVVMELPSDDIFTIFGIYRDDELHLDVDTMEIHAGDRICALGTLEGITRLNEIIGVVDIAREFVILGGSIVGRNLARLLSNDPKKRYVKIIDRSPETCRELSKILTGVVVINGDFTEPDVQTAENVFKVDCTISTSRLDDTNLLMCMSAQKFNARKIVSRYFKKEYEDIFTFTGLESIVGYYKIVSNEITKCTISDEMAIVRMRSHNELFFNHSVEHGSKLLDRYYGDIPLPEGIRIVAVVRDGEVIYPRLDTLFRDGDSAIVFTNLTREEDLARVFGRNIVAEL